MWVNRVTLAVCRSLPVCTQHRTRRCAAITDAMCQERPFGNHVVTLAFRRRPSFEVTSMYVRTKHQDEPQRIRGHGVRRGRFSRGGARCSAQPEGSDRHVHPLGKHNDPAVIEKQKTYDRCTRQVLMPSWSPAAERQSGSPLLDGLPVSYTHLRAHETRHDLVCRLLLEK